MEQQEQFDIKYLVARRFLLGGTSWVTMDIQNSSSFWNALADLLWHFGKVHNINALCM